MNKIEFQECIEMLRSPDPMTYEEGYHWLQGFLDKYLDELVKLMLDEKNPQMRAKFLELVGDSKSEKIIPVIQDELKSKFSEVRSWAYSSLCYFENEQANNIAQRFREEYPNEEFL